MLRKSHKDTRSDYAPLADGEKYKAPGQTEPVTKLIERGRMVPVRLGRIEESR